jgi:hypothetical protein
MIYLPGKNINMLFEVVKGPWIDTSRRNAVNSLPFRSPERILWPQWGIEGHQWDIKSEKPVSSNLNRGPTMCMTTGNPPPRRLKREGSMTAQRPGTNGSDAGNVIISVLKSVEGIPYIVAVGEDGRNGHQGFKSPFCIDGTYYQGYFFAAPCNQKKTAVSFNRGFGSVGGSGGNGGSITYVSAHSVLSNVVLRNMSVSPGVGANGGPAGACGSGNVKTMKGKKGNDGKRGKIIK